MKPNSILWGAPLLMDPASSQTSDYTQYVNIFLGTEGGGNMFPGAVSEPFAVVKLGPDVRNGGVDGYSGYQPQGNITGFSMTHESGTGGAPKYGVMSQMPALGDVANPLADLSVARAAADQAEVGRYTSFLSSGVTVQLASTAHAAMYSYTFRPSLQANVVIDVSHVLLAQEREQWTQHYVSGNISVASDGSYQGSGTYNNGWNLAPDWTIYFCGHFDSSVTGFKTFAGNGTDLAEYGKSASAAGGERVGAVFSFSDSNVSSRVGVSFISSAQACQYIDDEIPTGTPYQTLVNAAKDNWNTKVLSKIQTSSTDSNTLRLLYTSLYGMHLIPSNKTGENPKWSSSEPYYDDIFTYWDLFRCATSLMQILQPISYEEQIRSIVDIWRHDDYLPDARSSNFNGRSQGGSNADNVLADAYVKGVRSGVNWDDAYKAMVKDAEVVPPNNNDASAPDSSTMEGRGALPDWLEYGYITPNYTRAVSRAVEYSANDHALHVVAAGLGNTADSDKYLNRSRNWRNHYDPAATALNHSGFVVPRFANGSFDSTQDPLTCGGCYWGDAYYEGTPWEYTFNAHHDIQHLITLSGGTETFVEKLDMIFQPNSKPDGNPAFNKTIFDPGNEPSFASPYLFNFAGRQDLSAQRSREVAKWYYNTSPGGLPGNSDAGAMQTWLLWNMIGLFPLTGQTTFLIASPWCNLTIDLGEGKKLVISVVGGSDEAIYVQSLKVNGNDWNKSWVTWEDVFANGGTMDYVLGQNPSDWSNAGELPPSPAS
ncbi:hypothetical protein ACLMJK_004504 [Lecanora helva]